MALSSTRFSHPLWGNVAIPIILRVPNPHLYQLGQKIRRRVRMLRFGNRHLIWKTGSHFLIHWRTKIRALDGPVYQSSQCPLDRPKRSSIRHWYQWRNRWCQGYSNCENGITESNFLWKLSAAQREEERTAFRYDKRHLCKKASSWFFPAKSPVESGSWCC